jgi:hypothetical protein
MSGFIVNRPLQPGDVLQTREQAVQQAPDTQGAGYGELVGRLRAHTTRERDMGMSWDEPCPLSQEAATAILDLSQTLDNVRKMYVAAEKREAALEADLARAAAGIATMLPKNMSLDNPRWPDSTTVPLDTTLGELRALRSLLTELSEPKS